jgi:hypothetical protein
MRVFGESEAPLPKFTALAEHGRGLAGLGARPRGDEHGAERRAEVERRQVELHEVERREAKLRREAEPGKACTRRSCAR